jgi:hypothetical protein
MRRFLTVSHRDRPDSFDSLMDVWYDAASSFAGSLLEFI